MSDERGKALTLQELPELRRKTEAVSRFLKDQIAAHLETLRPLFAPERILGKHAGGKEDVSGAERTLAELQQNFKAFTNKPFDLPERLDPNWLTLVGNALELYPWEYAHTVQSKTISMTSPVRWAINYRSNYSLGQMKNVLAGKETVRPDYLRQFVVNSLVLQLALNRNAGLARLFQDLRYDLKSESPSDLKKLPVVTITSSLESFRPSDDLIAAAAAFSGVPAFIELIEIETAAQQLDPLSAKIAELVK